ncbi:MAG: S-layer family protein [Cyanobacteria bacterium P01_F01_bin.150]
MLMFLGSQRFEWKSAIRPRAYITIASLIEIATYSVIGIGHSAFAQVTPDGILSTTVTTTDNLNFVIENGDRAGHNLFHSFDEFSIPSNGSAIFSNDTTIRNIFSRITGTTISDIDGLIQANGTAHFFLINPNGIVFGPNAQLDVGGSFLASTADSLLFDDGIEFSAIEPNALPLLSIRSPIGLQLGTNPSDIQLFGRGDIIVTNVDPLFISSLIRQSTPAHLEVSDENTLALVGGNITLNNSGLRANEGRVELGAVSNGMVAIQTNDLGWTLDYTQATVNRDILLESQSALDASGTTSNGIQILGRDITFQDGSVALVQVSGPSVAAELNVAATGSVTIAGTDPTALLASSIRIETLTLGEAGGLWIHAPHLIIQEGAEVGTLNLGANAGSDLNLNIEQSVFVDGFSPLNLSRFSRLGAITLGTGDGGDINLSTRALTLEDGGTIGSITIFNTGSSGDIVIDALDFVEIRGETAVTDPSSEIPLSSSINTSTLGLGDAGRIQVNTARLRLSASGDIDSSTISIGNAGEVILDATSSITVDGEAGLLTRISSSALENSGLQLVLGLPDILSGNGGAVTINTPRLNVTGVGPEGGEISVANNGVGVAGNLTINADAIYLEHEARLLASTASGEGGNIHLDLANRLVLRHGGHISATAQGMGNGGNINIQSPFIVTIADENSDIIANAVQGHGGNIDITTQGLFGLKFRDRLTPNNDITASSELGLDGTIEVNNPEADPNSQVLELPDTLADASQLVRPGCSLDEDQFVLAGRGGLPSTPMELMDGDRPWFDIRDLSAFIGHPSAKLSAVGEQPTPAEPIQEATRMAIAPDGEIQLLVSDTSGVVTPHATCTSSPVEKS